MAPGDPSSFKPGVAPPESVPEKVWCFAFRQRELLVTHELRMPEVSAIDSAGLEAVRTQYIGVIDDRHCYSVELADDTQPPPAMAFRDLRSLFGRLPELVHAVAGRAIQIVEWDRTHQYCGACRAETVRSDKERSRRCPECGLVQFPRISPAMIVAVERGDEILLARGPQFPAGIYSVLAGFVEPGESVEEAVVREVYEETAISVRDVRYFASQPWPFPNSLMLGFMARYESGEICCDGTEIEDAAWFRPEAMPTLFPGNISISQWLIQDFLRRNGGGSP